jgi:septum formation protein
MRLFLASSSKSRQRLLTDSFVDFEVIKQDYNEPSFGINPSHPIEFIVSQVAKKKFEHSYIPFSEIKEDSFFVLTADTLSQFENGEVFGKPKTIDDARFFLKCITGTVSYCSTAFYLVMFKRMPDGQFKLFEIHTEAATASLWIEMSSDDIERYLGFYKERVLDFSGAYTMTGYGNRFLRKIDGSYSTIIGMPIYELLRAMRRLGGNTFIS